MNLFFICLLIFSNISKCLQNGLGGAQLKLTCTPSQVSLGTTFSVNLDYNLSIPRIADIHVDVLNANSKQWLAGNYQTVYSHSGSVSIPVHMERGDNPIMWKVYITPTSEPFPNMLAETGFVADLGPFTISSCESQANQFYNETLTPVNFVLIDKIYVPKVIEPSKEYKIPIIYNLLENTFPIEINISIMDRETNQALYHDYQLARFGTNEIIFLIKTPAQLSASIYLVSTLVPANQTWENRFAEDRTYNIIPIL
jgi:hypothetical protein